MSEKILVFSDLHAHNHKAYSRDNDKAQNSRLKVAIDALDQMLEYALENGIYRVIFAGDLFDTKKRVHVGPLNAVYDLMSKWAPYCMDVLMIPGNHDFATRTGEDHSLEIFRHIPGFVVVDEPSVVEWSGFKVCCVPYRDEFQPEWFEDADFFVGHGAVEGLCQVPVSFDEDPDAPNGEWIRQSWLRKYKFSAVGHIHDPVFQSTSNGVILVPGCPYQDDPYGSVKDRGFWIFDPEEPSVNLVQSRSPRFIRIKIKKDGEVCKSEEGDIQGNIMLVEPDSHMVSSHRLIRFEEELYQKGANYVQIIDPESTEEDSMDAAVRVQMSPHDDEKEVLQKVLDSGLIDLKGLSFDELFTLGCEILGEVAEEGKK